MTVDSFTELTDDQALTVLNYVKSLDIERRRNHQVNPERRSSDTRMRA